MGIHRTNESIRRVLLLLGAAGLFVVVFLWYWGSVHTPVLIGNEHEAIALMRSIADAEVKFKDMRLKDSDGDGVGEYGSLAELAAHEEVWKPGSPDLKTQAAGGDFADHGYLFRSEVQGVSDCDANEVGFFVTAWPEKYKESGEPEFQRTFYIDQTGVLRQKVKKGLPATSDEVSKDPKWPTVGG